MALLARDSFLARDALARARYCSTHVKDMPLMEKFDGWWLERGEFFVNKTIDCVDLGE